LVKRYINEAGSEELRAVMSRDRRWVVSRLTYVEVLRALGRVARDTGASGELRLDWPTFEVVELSEPVAERAAALAVEEDLRSLDAVQLSCAIEVAGAKLSVVTWDSRLHRAAARRGLPVLPASL